MARSGATSHPTLVRVLLARQINAALGGAFVSPADIDEMDDTTIEELTASMSTELSDLQKAYRTREQAMAAWRAKHPTYRKHRG